VTAPAGPGPKADRPHDELERELARRDLPIGDLRAAVVALLRELADAEPVEFCCNGRVGQPLAGRGGRPAPNVRREAPE
jgi:hypothetical protein